MDEEYTQTRDEGYNQRKINSSFGSQESNQEQNSKKENGIFIFVEKTSFFTAAHLYLQFILLGNLRKLRLDAVIG